MADLIICNCCRNYLVNGAMNDIICVKCEISVHMNCCKSTIDGFYCEDCKKLKNNHGIKNFIHQVACQKNHHYDRNHLNAKLDRRKMDDDNLEALFNQCSCFGVNLLLQRAQSSKKILINLTSYLSGLSKQPDVSSKERDILSKQPDLLS